MTNDHGPQGRALIPPWLLGPSELLEHALEMVARPDSDKNRRLALLAIDNSVEITVKTFLALPDARGGLGIAQVEVRKLNFYALFERLRESDPSYLEGLDQEKIRYYHEQRNEFYHSETGHTARREIVDDYAVVAQTLFTALYGVPAPQVGPSTKPSMLEGPGVLAAREQELLVRLQLEQLLRDLWGESATMPSRWRDQQKRLTTQRWGPSDDESMLVEEVDAFLREQAELRERSAEHDKDSSGSEDDLVRLVAAEFLELEESLFSIYSRLMGHSATFIVPRGPAGLALELVEVLPRRLIEEILDLAGIRAALAHGRTPGDLRETLEAVQRTRESVGVHGRSLDPEHVKSWRTRRGLPLPYLPDCGDEW